MPELSAPGPRITPFLWFAHEAEEAAAHYVSVFPGSRITGTTRHRGEPGPEGVPRPGDVLTVAFELDGQPFVALNGGPAFRFTEAISFMVSCADQAEVDHYWARLGEGGDPAAQQCGSRIATASPGRSCRPGSPSSWPTRTRSAPRGRRRRS